MLPTYRYVNEGGLGGNIGGYGHVGNYFARDDQMAFLVSIAWRPTTAATLSGLRSITTTAKNLAKVLWQAGRHRFARWHQSWATAFVHRLDIAQGNALVSAHAKAYSGARKTSTRRWD